MQKEERGEVPLLSMDRIMAWNIKGLNQREKKIDFMKMIEIYHIGMVGLLEIRVKAAKLGAVYLSMFKGWCFTTNLRWNKGGRIMLASDPKVFSMNKMEGNGQFIHCQVTLLEQKQDFMLTIVYAHNKKEERRGLWKGLMAFNTTDPWLIMGDFNDILNAKDRIGAKAKCKSGLDFSRWVRQCRMEDVPYSGCKYTWNNKQLGDDRICSKIVRAMANEAWLERFDKAEAIFLDEGYFDHSPGMIICNPRMASGKKFFRFFRMWKTHPRFMDLVVNVWKE